MAYRYNPWAMLGDLIAGQPDQAGTVQAIHSDGSLDVELFGGGVLRVDDPTKGNGYTVGDNVSTKGNSVTGQLPSGDIVDVDV